MHELTVPARQIRPSDHLPPQRALHATRYQERGFTVGPAESDVVDLPVLSGRMMLSGPDGRLSTVPHDAQVVVHRCATGCEV
jgi:hypothetical protein